MSSGFMEVMSKLGQDKTTPLKDGTCNISEEENITSRIIILENAYTALDIQVTIIISWITTVETMHITSTTSLMPNQKTLTYLADGKWSKVAEICVSVILETVLTLGTDVVMAPKMYNGDS